MVHYAGHGVCKVNKAKFAQLLLEDGDLSVRNVRRKETQLGKNRHSLVFFNACEVGASGLNLGVIGGFAEALTEDEFGAFIAPLWAVYDGDASEVLSEFLQHVLLSDKRQTFATALQNIRIEFGEQSPTFLSYTYYGDVMARFV
jgi:CHAT domain-containing protein